MSCVPPPSEVKLHIWDLWTKQRQVICTHTAAAKPIIPFNLRQLHIMINWSRIDHVRGWLLVSEKHVLFFSTTHSVGDVWCLSCENWRSQRSSLGWNQELLAACQHIWPADLLWIPMTVRPLLQTEWVSLKKNTDEICLSLSLIRPFMNECVQRIAAFDWLPQWSKRRSLKDKRAWTPGRVSVVHVWTQS